MLHDVSSAAISRRSLLGLAGLGAGAALLSACSGPSTTSAAGSASAGATGGPSFDGVTPAKTISFWSNHPGSSQAITQSIIKKFKAQSGITVNLVTAGSTYKDVAQKFQSAQAGGQLPDLVVLSDVWWFRYYMQDSIIPLGNVIKAAGLELSDYRDGLVADYQYKGEQWAVPWARSTPLFYYNKNHFKAAGLPDRAPTSWEEFATWAPKLMAVKATTKAKYAYEIPALAGYAGWTLQNTLWGYGGGWSRRNSFDITCDSPATVKALNYFADAVNTSRWAGVASTAAIDDLAAGACSATIESTGSLVGVQKSIGSRFQVGVGFLPGGPVSTKPVCPTGGAGVGIPKGIDKANQLAAAKFIAFLTNPENTVDFSSATGYMPVRKSADTSSLLEKNALIGTAIKQLDVTRAQDWARVFMPGADQEIAKAVAGILTQKADTTATMKSLRSTLEGIYTSQVKPHLN
ncbi:ABC transporter substrate-binding protein [Acidipropionibacterium thoenii]|uniref:ABC transporter substrate-binding protein n=1 Tax=Acidipropionibacterium thoenii TaxID=1751 RepID=UPI000402C293|nr:ABC transporter substrate-binding protein [Acidipropionibacterium thoenii]